MFKIFFATENRTLTRTDESGGRSVFIRFHPCLSIQTVKLCLWNLCFLIALFAINTNTHAKTSEISLTLQQNFVEEFAIAGGQPQQLLLEVANQGDEPASFLHVTSKMDGRLDVIDVDCGFANTQPQQTAGTNFTRGGFVDCVYDRLPAIDGVATITVTFSIDPGTDAAVISNLASAEDDSGQRRNAFDAIEVVEDSRMALEMSFEDAQVDAGTGPHKLRITARNVGFSHRTNVNVTNTLDHRLQVAEVDCGATGVNRSRGQIVDCMYDLLVAGGLPETITITYSTKSEYPSDTVSNVATVLDDDGNGAQAFGIINIVGDVTAGVDTPDEERPNQSPEVIPAGPAFIELVSLMVVEVAENPVQHRIEWKTSTEVDTLGFNILRGTYPDIEIAVKINDTLILALGDPATEEGINSYHFDDTSALAEVDYVYWLVEVEQDQDENIYGPIRYILPSRSDRFDETLDPEQQYVFMPIIMS